MTHPVIVRALVAERIADLQRHATSHQREVAALRRRRSRNAARRDDTVVVGVPVATTSSA